MGIVVSLSLFRYMACVLNSPSTHWLHFDIESIKMSASQVWNSEHRDMGLLQLYTASQMTMHIFSPWPFITEVDAVTIGHPSLHNFSGSNATRLVHLMGSWSMISQLSPITHVLAPLLQMIWCCWESQDNLAKCWNAPKLIKLLVPKTMTK